MCMVQFSEKSRDKYNVGHICIFYFEEEWFMFMLICRMHLAKFDQD
jgi:hypothetical protein